LQQAQEKTHQTKI